MIKKILFASTFFCQTSCSLGKELNFLNKANADESEIQAVLEKSKDKVLYLFPFFSLKIQNTLKIEEYNCRLEIAESDIQSSKRFKDNSHTQDFIAALSWAVHEDKKRIKKEKKNFLKNRLLEDLILAAATTIGKNGEFGIAFAARIIY